MEETDMQEADLQKVYSAERNLPEGNSPETDPEADSQKAYFAEESGSTEELDTLPLYVPPLSGHPGTHRMRRDSKKGVLSLTFGALAFLLFAAFINIPLGIASIVLGCLQLAGHGKKGCPIAGIILSLLSFILLFIFWYRYAVVLTGI